MRAVKPIRTERDYKAALARIDELESGAFSPDAERELEVLVDLAELYERKTAPVDLPDPVTAIKVRMEDLGLDRRDLIPLIGSRAKVAEILAGKRPITMPMARALYTHLHLPADVLLQDPQPDVSADGRHISIEEFPFGEMAKLGWIPYVENDDDIKQELIDRMIERAGGIQAINAVRFRKSAQRVNAKSNRSALMAWCWQALAIANESGYPEETFDPDSDWLALMKSVAQLSSYPDGPLQAQMLLSEHGISLVVLPHLSKTYLDGAALNLQGVRPVIGLTARYDRLDNFWFCLLHELAHVYLHRDHANAFLDDLDLDGRAHPDELEADKVAQDSLIPPGDWNDSAARSEPTMMNVIGLANSLGIHPAIVAGRVRHERNDFRRLTQLVGRGEVRKQFRGFV